ncbi:MAG: ABC transporter ATP-binding protein, partial [Phaeodactylibacter sp.]|nr:ABC transporter ATP-binding protein [Phaeodactylibacter sp.]
CVIIVTHDRYFMDKIVEHLFVFEGEGHIRDFNGVYSDYREIQKGREREQRREERAEQQKGREQQQAQEQKASGLSQEERKELKRLEKQILQLEERKQKITEQFNSTGLSPEKITELSKELAALKEEVEEKEMRWMELAELA